MSDQVVAKYVYRMLRPPWRWRIPVARYSCLIRHPIYNLLAWIVEVNGLPVDVRAMPSEVQEEAYRLGLIPSLP